MKHCAKCMHAHKRHEKKKEAPKKSPKGDQAKKKITKVMREYKQGALHSGSKKGPKVKSRRRAVAIALSEARRGKKK
jgi:cytochrome c553